MFKNIISILFVSLLLIPLSSSSSLYLTPEQQEYAKRMEEFLIKELEYQQTNWRNDWYKYGSTKAFIVWIQERSHGDLLQWHYRIENQNQLYGDTCVKLRFKGGTIDENIVTVPNKYLLIEYDSYTDFGYIEFPQRRGIELGNWTTDMFLMKLPKSGVCIND